MNTEALDKICGAIACINERDAASRLTLRDQFAIAALPGVMASFEEQPFGDSLSTSERLKRTAAMAYKIADAMLSQRAIAKAEGRA